MKIRCPTMILTNTGDQIYENAKLAHSMRPDFAFVAIPGGGIDITDQCPAEWVDAIDTYMRQE
jgi:pimeloyl-ACP methyl ester carboxylesterase